MLTNEGNPSQPFLKEIPLPGKKKLRRPVKVLLILLPAVLFLIVNISFLIGRLGKEEEPSEQASEAVHFEEDFERSRSDEGEDVQPTGDSDPQPLFYSLLFSDMEEDEKDELRAIIEQSRGVSALADSLATCLVELTDRRYGTMEENTGSGLFGVIISISGKEVLILTPSSSMDALQTKKSALVRFYDNTYAAASLKAQDSVGGLVMLSAPVAVIPSTTLDRLHCVVLGNSYTCYEGQPVLFLGAPRGHNGSAVLGAVTYLESNVAYPDCSHLLLHTNIRSHEKDAGLLFSMEGDLIGWLDDSPNDSGDISAIGISGLKTYLAQLGNNLPTSYLGVRGITLTPLQQSELGVSSGIFVSSTVPESPARAAGIQSGDILTHIESFQLTGLFALQKYLSTFPDKTEVRISLLRKGDIGYTPLTMEVNLTHR